MKTDSNLINARARRDAIRDDIRGIYMSAKQLRSFVEEAEKNALALALTSLPLGPDYWAAENYQASFNSARGDNHLGRLATNRALLAVVENSAEYKEAVKIIEPILADVEALEEAERAELAAVSNAAQELADAEKKAVADLKDHPAVAAARASLDKVKSGLRFVTSRLP